MRKIDKESREMLRYLNLHNKLSSVTLAEVFCQNYKIELDNALEILSFLENNELVRVKTNDDGSILMIQVTHGTLQQHWTLIHLFSRIQSNIMSLKNRSRLQNKLKSHLLNSTSFNLIACN